MPTADWTTPPHVTPKILWTMRGLAAVMMTVSGHLLWVSLVSGREALGCGAGAGCGEVLASPWSKVLGMPVSAAAVFADIAMLAALFCVGRRRIASPRAAAIVEKTAWAVLLGLSGVVLASAAWFVGLQAFVLKSYCPLCLADHFAGVFLAGLVWKTTVMRTAPRAIGDISVRNVRTDAAAADVGGVGPTVAAEPRLIHEASPAAPFPLDAAACLIGMGICCAGFVFAVQIAFPSAGPAVKRLAEIAPVDSGPGPSRRIAVLGGLLSLEPHALPTLGSPDAPVLLVVLSDYCCSHCRQLHGWLEAARKRNAGRMAMVVLPTPQHPRCNPEVNSTELRFEHACELARLALAVHRAEPGQFAAFDHWLFESEQPRLPDAARRQAEALVGRLPLERTLADAWIDARIAADVAAIRRGGLDRIPVVLSPGFSAIVGRPADEPTVNRILLDELGLK